MPLLTRLYGLTPGQIWDMTRDEYDAYLTQAVQAFEGITDG